MPVRLPHPYRLVLYLFWCLLAGGGLLSCTEPGRPSETPRAAQRAVRPYPAPFGYGSNLGYYGATWTDEQLAAATRKAGGGTMRVTLPAQFLAKWGTSVRLPTFRYYTDSLGLRDLVCFVGEPDSAHRDPVTYPGCREQSKLFANLYEPIWNPDSTLNPNNYYAQYIYQVLQLYGRHIRVWEVVNEPDFITDTSNQEWEKREPAAGEMVNIQAPIYRYIRTLRITWEVVKKYQPQAYVAPGGIGYPQYLDALLRYTDNPHDGSLSAHYPSTGGAYFDVVSYHVYPAYDLRHRNWLKAGRFSYTRNSDFAAAQVIAHKQQMADVLHKYGYGGTPYAQKHFIVTETNISRRTSDWRYGTDEMQRNFGIKALVLAQKNDIRQLHFYHLAETADAPPPGAFVTDEYTLMGLYKNLSRVAPGQARLTQLGQALQTTTRLLQGLSYDTVRTQALQLPETAEGAAFSNQQRTVYVLWAKTPDDCSEAAQVQYSFPAALLKGKQILRYTWNHFSSPGKRPSRHPFHGILLTGTPAYFAEAATATRSARQKRNGRSVAIATLK